MPNSRVLGLFEGYGIELEYMMIGCRDFKAQPISEQVLRKLAGHDTMSIELGEIAWSNELAMHVIELKSNGPKKDLAALHRDMHSAITDMESHLSGFDACILPTAMHPLYDPEKELRLWDSEDSEIYAAYDRIFGCKGHGWANLQSIHINLPFSGDAEFAKLHTAIRLILPLMPAVAASSPFVQGKRGPLLDSRVHFYLQNQRRIATIIGQGIPEAVRSKAEYEDVILKPMYRDISPHDPEGLLQHEWLNSRAAIARFQRNAIEIRILDIQECLASDFAIITGFVSILQTLVSEHWSRFDNQFQIPVATLRRVLDGVLTQGLSYRIEDRDYLAVFGQSESLTVRDLLHRVIEDLKGDMCRTFGAYKLNFEFLLTEGSLSERILASVGDNPTPEAIEQLYREFNRCLIKDKPFNPKRDHIDHIYDEAP